VVMEQRLRVKVGRRRGRVRKARVAVHVAAVRARQRIRAQRHGVAVRVRRAPAGRKMAAAVIRVAVRAVQGRHVRVRATVAA
jgi:hypothetical protein